MDREATKELNIIRKRIEAISGPKSPEAIFVKAAIREAKTGVGYVDDAADALGINRCEYREMLASIGERVKDLNPYARVVA